MADYSWQEDTFKLWEKNGFRGLLDGVPSAGKTHAACMAIQKYRELFGSSEIWVIAPTNEILNQWKKELGEENATYCTYLTAVNRLSKRAKLDKFDVPDLLVLDEAHTATAPVAGKVLTFGVPHILGLSGTPEGIEKAIGGRFQKVPWACANIAPTTIHYVVFSPTSEELEKYSKWGLSIDKYKEDHPHSSMWNDDILQMLYLRRRGCVYNMASRKQIALSILKQNPGRRTMMFFERKAQVMAFSEILDGEGIQHCIHISGKEHLDDYLDGKSDIVLCCKKLKQGFSDPTTTLGIVVSTALGKANHIQTIGRIIRPLAGKHADIYILLASFTTDMELYGCRLQMFPKEMIQRIDWTKEMTQI